MTILKNKAPILCRNYEGKFDRTTLIADRYVLFVKEVMALAHNTRFKFSKRLHIFVITILENPVTKEEVPRLGVLYSENVNFETPDEVLVKYFTEEELQMVINYY